MKRLSLIMIIALLGILSIQLASASSVDVYCQNFGSKDICLKDIAFQKNDPTYCRDIDSVSVRNDCYSRLADQLNDQSLCDKVRKSDGTYEDKWDCLEEFFEGTEEEKSICEQFEGDDETQDDCYEFFFKRLDDTSLCTMMKRPKDIINCFEDASIDMDDINLCDEIKNHVNAEDCKDQGVDKCDTSTKINDIIADCRENLVYTRLKIRCKTYKPKMDPEMKEGDKNDLVFRGDDTKTESFSVEVNDINMQTGYTSLNLKVGRSRRDFNLKQGSTANLDFVYATIMRMWQEDDEDENDLGEKRVQLCLHRKPKPEEPDDEIEEKDMENADDNEAEVNVEVVEDNHSEDKDEKIVIDILPENNTDSEQKEEKVGILRSIIKWFWGLFGLGKS